VRSGGLGSSLLHDDVLVQGQLLSVQNLAVAKVETIFKVFLFGRRL
jgi:hypothetical protein